MTLRSMALGAATGTILLAAVLAGAPSGATTKAPVAFFLIGDTHLLADKKEPSKLDDRSAGLLGGLVAALNKLPGSAIPAAAGGGTVLAPRGVIHAGDCIDTGDQAKPEAQRTEWSAYVRAFGLTGNDGKLRFPIYEVHGNHDAPRGDGLMIQQIIARNKTRPGVTNTSSNGLHYSWDWDDIHFVSLGIVVGKGDGVTERRRYDPRSSLEFLIADLKDKVGDSGRPVVITHHVDMLRYAQAPANKKVAGSEWDPDDVQAFHAALKGYNIAAILYGHTHARNVFRWDGSAKAAATGIPVFNVTRSSHYSSKVQGFFYLEMAGGDVTVREYQTKDGWDHGSWTPQSWTAKYAVNSK